MELWGSIILYSFIAYLFLHLVLEDVVYVYKTIFEVRQREQVHTNNQSVPRQEGDVAHIIDQSIAVGDIEQAAYVFPENNVESSENEHKSSESGNRNPEYVQTSHFYQLQKRYIQNSAQYTAILKQRQSTVISLFYKLADITVACVMGYFHIFQVCWIACLTCLQVILLRYIDFLKDLTHTLADKEVVKYTAGSAVLCVAIACITVCVIFSILAR